MVLSIDFYRLIDKIDNVLIWIIDSYRFIERFSDIGFLSIELVRGYIERYSPLDLFEPQAAQTLVTMKGCKVICLP